jgi:hypothetical protein
MKKPSGHELSIKSGTTISLTQFVPPATYVNMPCQQNFASPFHFISFPSLS